MRVETGFRPKARMAHANWKDHAPTKKRVSVQMGEAVERRVPLEGLDDQRLKYRTLRVRYFEIGRAGSFGLGRQLVGFGQQIGLIHPGAAAVAHDDLAADDDGVDACSCFVHDEMRPYI